MTSPRIGPRFARRLALWLWLGSLFLLLAAVPLANPLGVGLRGFIEATVYATVGAVVARRHPANPIGWLFCIIGLVVAFEFFGTQYVSHGQPDESDPLPVAKLVAWVARGGTELSVPLVAFVFLLFPQGRLLSPHWRPVAWLAVAAAVLGATISVLSAIGSSAVLPYEGIRLRSATLELLVDVYGGILALLLVASSLCVVLRQRRALADERQQIKWFTFAVALVITTGAVGTATTGGDPSLALWVAPAIPIAAAIAILRYHLYDIDIIINRTLVYSALTATLGSIYVVGVFVLQQLLSPLTPNSSLAVAGSTLIVAAVFRPARVGIQDHIDRRFFRTKYDARATLDAFSARVQREIDLEDLTGELLKVVKKTLQPVHASLWLRSVGPERSPPTVTRGGSGPPHRQTSADRSSTKEPAGLDDAQSLKASIRSRSIWHY